MRKLLIGSFLLVLAAVGWLYWSPGHAADQIQAAAAAEDTTALAELVDYPMLRTTLKDQFDRVLLSRMPNGPGEIGRALISAVTEPLAERLGSPQGVVFMVRNASPFIPLGDATITTRVQREDHTRAMLILIRSDSPRDSTMFALERDGWQWRMTGAFITEVIR
ncbi:MAG: DUF2939 domain-containing protein [Actinomycetota bacterium]|nr:DUF2939 domain-containing protein [Actinomycetota bacterium]